MLRHLTYRTLLAVSAIINSNVKHFVLLDFTALGASWLYKIAEAKNLSLMCFAEIWVGLEETFHVGISEA